MPNHRDPQQLLNRPSSTELVNELLRYAFDLAASDIHLVPVDHGLEVFVRHDGELDRVGLIRPDLVPTVIGRLKVLADLLVYRTDIPQEGRIPRELSGLDSEVRVSSYPALMGEKIAVRLDAQRERKLDLSKLGFDRDTLLAIEHALQQPEGVVLLTGPSGSGKTTTLYACLKRLTTQTRRRTIVTVEDPVERRIDGVVQTEVNAHVGVTFGTALRSILRQDPDVLLLGEIRDHETAAVALEAGLTGHLVASTVHAGSAAQVFTRLIEMGIEPFAITSVVRGVLSQRLVRRLCTVEARDHANCGACQGSGFHGRTLIAEWLPMTEELRRAILARGDSEELAAAAALSGYEPLRSQADRLISNGITTQQEVLRVLGQDQVQSDLPLGDECGGSDPLPSHAGGDVPGVGAAAEGAPPVIPRPQPGSAAQRLDDNGAGSGVGDGVGGSVRETAGAPAEAVSSADPSGDH